MSAKVISLCVTITNVITMDRIRKSSALRLKSGSHSSTPAVIYGRASRFVSGYGRTPRGRHCQTDPSPPQETGEIRPSKALAACETALGNATAEIDAIQRRHRQRWIQHHIFMRKAAVWEKEVYQRSRNLQDAFSSVSQNIRAALPYRINLRSTTNIEAVATPNDPARYSATTPVAQPGPSRNPKLPTCTSDERPTSPGSDVCLSEEQLHAWANGVLQEFEHSYKAL